MQSKRSRLNIQQNVRISTMVKELSLSLTCWRILMLAIHRILREIQFDGLIKAK